MNSDEYDGYRLVEISTVTPGTESEIPGSLMSETARPSFAFVMLARSSIPVTANSFIAYVRAGALSTHETARPSFGYESDMLWPSATTHAGVSFRCLDPPDHIARPRVTAARARIAVTATGGKAVLRGEVSLNAAVHRVVAASVFP